MHVFSLIAYFPNQKLSMFTTMKKYNQSYYIISIIFHNKYWGLRVSFSPAPVGCESVETCAQVSARVLDNVFNSERALTELGTINVRALAT